MKHGAILINQIFPLWLAVTLALFLLLVIVPYFLLGIYQQPAYLVMGGSFDPKGIPPFSDNQADPGYWLYVLSLITLIATPIVTSIAAPIVGLALVGNWRQIPGIHRVATLMIVLGGVALVLFLFTSSLRRLMMTWWLD